MLLKISQAQTKKSSTLAVGDEGAAGADLPSAHDPHREAPVACPDPECSLFFNERPSFWWHVKFEHFLKVVSQNKLNRSRGAQPRAMCTARVTPQGHGGGDVLHFDPSKKQSNHKRNDARSDNAAFTDPRRAVDKDKGKSAHLVLHCDAEGPWNKRRC